MSAPTTMSLRERLLEIAGSMRNHADVAEHCDITKIVNTIPSMRVWADMLAEEAIAALSTPPADGDDTKRIDWLEKVGFATRNPDVSLRPANVHCWSDGNGWSWTAHYVGSEFKSARAAIDAAMIAATEGSNNV